MDVEGHDAAILVGYAPEPDDGSEKWLIFGFAAGHLALDAEVLRSFWGDSDSVFVQPILSPGQARHFGVDVLLDHVDGPSAGVVELQ